MEAPVYLVDLYMQDRFLFPNAYMDEAASLPQLRRRVYDLYFVLRGDRYEVRSWRAAGAELLVDVSNVTRGETYRVRFNVPASFSVPDASCLALELRDRGALLHVAYSTKGRRCLLEREPDHCRAWLDRGFPTCTIYARNIFEMQMQADSRAYERAYEVLYIGQSKREDIFQRLRSHATLQRIMRDDMRRMAPQELYILIHSVAAKYIEQQEEVEPGLSLIAGDTIGRTFRIGGTVDHNAMIDIAEAMLIQHFQPPYNERLKKGEALEKLSTYRKVGESILSKVDFSLDPGWETGEKMVLVTQAARTATKARIITCDFAGGRVAVRHEDFPDAFY